MLEIARLSVKDESADSFETAFAEALPLVRAAEGHIESSLTRDTAAPNSYVFIVEWREISDHIETFAGSVEFARFQGLIGPHLADEPQVHHFTAI